LYNVFVTHFLDNLIDWLSPSSSDTHIINSTWTIAYRTTHDLRSGGTGYTGYTGYQGFKGQPGEMGATGVTGEGMRVINGRYRRQVGGCPGILQ